MAYFIFGETLTVAALVGMVIGIVGVALVIRRADLVAPEP
jgi:drug/metabolite transporter (DMT)-like permease